MAFLWQRADEAFAAMLRGRGAQVRRRSGPGPADAEAVANRLGLEVYRRPFVAANLRATGGRSGPGTRRNG